MAARRSTGGAGRRGRSHAAGKAPRGKGARVGKTGGGKGARVGKTGGGKTGGKAGGGKTGGGPRKKRGATPSKHMKPGKAARPGKRAAAKAQTARVARKGSKRDGADLDAGRLEPGSPADAPTGPRSHPRPPRQSNPGKIARRRMQQTPELRVDTGPDAAAIAAAPCPHFGPCGGCSELHRPYEDELRDKENALKVAVRDQAALASTLVEPIFGAEDPLYYRASLKVPFGTSPEGPVCGFYQRGTHRIVDLHTCLIQVPALTELIQVTRELVARCRVPIYHEHLHRGVLRHLVARIAPGTNEILAGLVVRRAGAPQIKKVAWLLHERMRDQGLVGVIENVNPEQTNAVLGPRSNRLVGRSVMFEEIDGLRLRTSLESFSQVNPAQASRIFSEVAALLDPIADRHVVDLYAGYGPIGLRLAKRGARVTAIERNRIAARDGIAIARANGLEERIRFVVADAAEGLEAATTDGLPDALVVDPPRRGLGTEVMDLLCARRIPKIIYVSCNPDTLLPNLERLAPVYRTEHLRPVDLFPRTEHVEVVASLTLRDA